MTRPWNPNRRLSDAEFRALSAAERRVLFAQRARGQREHRFERSIEQPVRRARPRPANPDGQAASLRLVGLAVLFAFVAAWNYAPASLFDRPAVAASSTSAVRASFGACKWGGGTNCVVDGDTLYLAGEKIRIAGIDAPETHDFDCDGERALGEAAAARLQQLVNSGAITLTSIDRDEDRYGRKLRNLAVDGRDVGDVLISEGLARAYAGGRRGWCG